jgi:hypothetical protein
VTREEIVAGENDHFEWLFLRTIHGQGKNNLGTRLSEYRSGRFALDILPLVHPVVRGLNASSVSDRQTGELCEL